MLRKSESIPQLQSALFDTHNSRTYMDWRARKLEYYPHAAQHLVVEIRDPSRVSRAEHAAIAQRIAAANMVIFTACRPMSPALFMRFCAHFGLTRLDKNLLAGDSGISELHVVPEGRAHDYIPYSNKPINWHTDGYYNSPTHLIHTMALHCVHPAAHGGANALLDHELVYLLLRDADPAFVTALMHPQCMTIPANIENGIELRAAQTGPVFSMHPINGNLHMRYTARTRSIEWRDDDVTRAALLHLESLLNSEHTPIFHHRMEAGHGILCNNVLHTRTAFEDGVTPDTQRLVLRARYYDCITIQRESL